MAFIEVNTSSGVHVNYLVFLLTEMKVAGRKASVKNAMVFIAALSICASCPIWTDILLSYCATVLKAFIVYKLNLSQTSWRVVGYLPVWFRSADAPYLIAICISNFAPFVDRSVSSWLCAGTKLRFHCQLLDFQDKIACAALKCSLLWLPKRQGFLRHGWHVGCYREVWDIEG